ncbi:hypothetical protein Mgra_00009157 [Meloidogyne graminicola]|uniref:Uncharacterized protein n=1 Tax=Meloidogyne graminicola TaxID=189291 RepID=A0A8S9ZDP2_9BILA|nr:hypothetical protein Mgra_00009157 [Meloidogyne graminicola]
MGKNRKNIIISACAINGINCTCHYIIRRTKRLSRMEEYESAMREWEENRPPGSASAGSDIHPFEKYKRKFEERESSKLSDSGDSIKVENKIKEEEEKPIKIKEKEREEKEMEEVKNNIQPGPKKLLKIIFFYK